MNMQPIIAASLLIAAGFLQSTVQAKESKQQKITESVESSVAQAQESKQPKVTEPVESSAVQAKAIVDRMASFMNKQQAYSIHAVASRDEQLAFGYNLQRNETVDLQVKFPAGLRADVTGDNMSRQFFFDGKNFTVYGAGENFYATIPAPATVGELIKSALSNDNVDMPLIDFLYNGTKSTLMDGVQSASYVGESSIDGVACHHLAFRQATIDWQLWVAKGDQPLPRKIVITTRFEYGDPRYSAVLSWDLAPKFNDNTFAFNAPAGAKQIPYQETDSSKSTDSSAK